LIFDLPMTQDFYRCWDGVLGDYVTAFLQYSLVTSLLVLWCRSNGRVPRQWFVFLGTLTIGILLGTLHALLRHENLDSARLILAIIAAATVIRLDRAIFGMYIGPNGKDPNASSSVSSSHFSPPATGVDQ